MPSAASVEVEVRAHSEYGTSLGAHRVRRELPAGTSTVTLDAPGLRPEAGWPGGRTILDVIVRDATGGATLDWGAASFEVAKAATVSGIKPGAEVYRRGDLMSVVVHAAGRLDALRLR